jgi:hypothetical protein
MPTLAAATRFTHGRLEKPLNLSSTPTKKAAKTPAKTATDTAPGKKSSFMDRH